MKKIVSLLLVCFILLGMLTSAVFAVGTEDNLMLAGETESGEQKVYSNATLEDDFADDRVMVVLSNEKSLEFNNFTAEDFSEIGCAKMKMFRKCVLVDG